MYLNIFSFMNIQGLHHQTKKIRDPKHLFVALFETWLTNTHKETELEIDFIDVSEIVLNPNMADLVVELQYMSVMIYILSLQAYISISEWS